MPINEQGLIGLDDLQADDVPKRFNPQIELGLSGLKRVSGYVDEEFLPQLRGRKAIQIFREMKDNDPIIGALLFATDRLLRQVTWRVTPASQKPEDQQAAQFVEECMDDLSHTWDDMLTEILTMLPFGWAWLELVYKRRVGPWEKNAAKRSKFTDNKIGWRKIPIRSQETWTRWVFDDRGGVKALVQMAPPTYQTTVIPIEKSLLFRISMEKNNPEGKSFLRNAYRPWYMKKRLEEIEAIGVERDLAGMPVAKVPRDYLASPNGTAQYDMVQAFKKMVRSVRRNEQEGVILPIEYDPDTKQPLFEFELMNSGGSRQLNINEIITRYEQRMLMSVLADFILVGHEGVGSYSMHTDKTGMFRASMNSIAETIADVFNRYAVPRLFAINGWKLDQLPTIVPSDIDPPDLAQLGQFMTQMQQAGVTWFPDVEMEKFVRDIARLPELTDDKEKVLQVQERQQQIMNVSQQRMQLMQMEQQTQQGQMQTDQMAQPDPAAAQGAQQAAQGAAQGAQQLQQSNAMHQMNMAAQKSKQSFTDKSSKQKLQQSDQMHKLKMAAMKNKSAKMPPKGKK